MKVLLANPRGFCAGVNMAIESLDRALELYGAPVYVFHEIVHNRTVVERFRDRGAIFVDRVDEVPPHSNLLFSAHGVSPEIREVARTRNLNALDATCPLVTKVHMEAIRFAAKGYHIFLIGHEGHDEVIGTMGEAPNSIELVECVEDVEKLGARADEKLAFVTQTTLSVDDANRIIRALRAKFPHIEGPNRDDICYATQNRQEAVRILAPGADVVLVLGSQNSSNSLRLAEIARESGAQAYLLDRARELQESWFDGIENVLITAGASAPEDVVQECVQYLKDKFSATVESQVIREENMAFLPPKPLRANPTPNP